MARALRQPGLDRVQGDAAVQAARIEQLTRDSRRLQKQLMRNNVQSETLLSELHEILDNRPVFIGIPARPTIEHDYDKHTEIAVFCVGDMHFGYYAPNDPDPYSIEIGTARLQSAVDKFIATTRDRRSSANIREVRVYVLGDMVEGEAMRLGQAHDIEGSVMQQACVWAPEALASVVVQLLEEFEKIKIVAVPGNHGRNGPKDGGAHYMTNWDTVCYEMARLLIDKAILQRDTGRLADVSWDLPTTRMTAGLPDWYSIDHVFGWVNCVLHGEGMKGGSHGGIPFYGVERLLKNYSELSDEPLDYLYMGHIHTAAVIPSNHQQIFVNGAIQSTSRYVLKELKKASPPAQLAVFYTEEHGSISSSMLYLGKRTPSGIRALNALGGRR